ncbi:MAG TPA: xanthine dehydrogenase family protein molybdopterin-binding subunit [Gemmatimonadaceae bacterium]|nr:xanthine dehydrogenase family protein molybdopterin-binding subunit [Gemmatimonadaceae bacterium]
MTGKRFVMTKVEVEGREDTRLVEIPDFEPAPWTLDARLEIVGQCVPRADAPEKVTGRAVYTADVARPGMLHAAIVRAPIAHGKVLSLDLTPCLEIAGVRDVLTLADVKDIRYDSGQLFDQTIRFAGQPVAAVAAETREAAERAVGAAIVRVDASPHAVTIAAALAPAAPKVRSTGNTSKHSPHVQERGDVEAGLRDADVVVTREFSTPCALHTAMEPHCAVAEWNGDQLTVWESTQGIFNTRSDLAKAFGLRLQQVRVIKDYMGGGFGAKNGAAASTYIAAALARRTRLPVRCVLDREGEQVDTGNRSATTQRATVAAKRDGTLTALVLQADVQMGVAGWFAGPGKIYHELYACPSVRTTETFVYTHTGAMASFRAPGHVEGAFSLERMMDILARELGIDPLELRRRNYAKHDQEKNRPYSDKNLDKCYEEGARRFGWNAFSAPPAPPLRGGPVLRGAETSFGVQAGRAAGAPSIGQPRASRAVAENNVKRGRGMASVAWPAGGGPPSYATVRINPDGSVDVLTGSQDLGTGARTVFAQIAAEGLGARVADVRTVLGDTERLPFTSNSWGSQTTASVGPAVRMAAEDARRRLFDAAATLLDASSDDLESRDSTVRVREQPNRALTFADIGAKLRNVMLLGHGSRGPNPDQTALSAFAAQFAEVEVNVETGQVRVLRIVAAQDSGRIINPRLAESQLEGGILQGVGFALFEERLLDDALGLPLNPPMHDH